mgnify:CR=1 FL=1
MGKRIGRFAMCRQLVERDPETARAVMGRCIVVRCEMMYEHDTFEYLAISPDFDEVPQGMIAPEYDVIISDGGKCIEFKRSNAKLKGGALSRPFRAPGWGAHSKTTGGNTQMAENEKNLKIEALRVAGGLHASPVANGATAGKSKPADVINTAKQIYEWLTA